MNVNVIQRGMQISTSSSFLLPGDFALRPPQGIKIRGNGTRSAVSCTLIVRRLQVLAATEIHKTKGRTTMDLGGGSPNKTVVDVAVATVVFAVIPVQAGDPASRTLR